MERFKRFSLVAASLMLVLAIVTVVGTKEVHGFVATMVQVANTALNPALASIVDNPGRIPYQKIVDNTGICSGNTCFFEFGGIPAGHRIVIQHVSGLLSPTSTPSQVLILVNNGSGRALSYFFAPFANSTIAFDQQVQVYFDPGQIIEIQASVFPATFAGESSSQNMTLTGYELTCSAATPCAAIAP